MNRTIRGRDLNGAQTFHAEEILPGEWRGVDIERKLGLAVYAWETLITRIADLIGSGIGDFRYIWELDISDPPARVSIDASRNTWIDHEYLDPSRYLPRLIPEKLETP